MRRFNEAVVAPVAAELDRRDDPADCFSWDIVEAADAAGIRTMTLTEEWGGIGADSLTTASPFRLMRMKETLETIPNDTFKGEPRDLINVDEHNYRYEDFTRAVQHVLSSKHETAGKPTFS